MAKGSNSVVSKIAAMAMIACMLVTAPRIDAAVTCSEVTNWLTPCIQYAVYGGEVAPECCAGVKKVIAAATTTNDRRTACSCIKDGVSAIPGINYDLVSKLPEKCGTKSPYQISPSTDCSKVN